VASPAFAANDVAVAAVIMRGVPAGAGNAEAAVALQVKAIAAMTPAIAAVTPAAAAVTPAAAAVAAPAVAAEPAPAMTAAPAVTAAPTMATVAAVAKGHGRRRAALQRHHQNNAIHLANLLR